MKISKPGVNVLTNTDPDKFIFSSDYGTLKYFETGNLTINLDGDENGITYFEHNLGYYPFFEVYLLNPIGEWEYCPTSNGGASTTWYSYVYTTTTRLYVAIASGGFEDPSEWIFKYFIYKNDLDL
jgi:hypothetical protein